MASAQDLPAPLPTRQVSNPALPVVRKAVRWGAALVVSGTAVAGAVRVANRPAEPRVHFQSVAIDRGPMAAKIGVRMAVGAKPWRILAQFLVEAMSLSMAGGLLGVGLGVLVAHAVAARFAFPFFVRIDMALLSIAFSAVVGVVFGIFPARKAARLDPIEALRYE